MTQVQRIKKKHIRMNQIPLLHSKCMYSKLVQVSISHDVRLCTTKHAQIFILLMNALYLIITYFF
jgi:hypothetical protein